MTMEVVKTLTRDNYPALIEVHVGTGLPGFDIVNKPGNIVREVRDRVRAGIISLGFDWPSRRITVNIAPAMTADFWKGMDYGIARGILAASGQLPLPVLHNSDGSNSPVLVGELRLDGTVMIPNAFCPVAEV